MNIVTYIRGQTRTSRIGTRIISIVDIDFQNGLWIYVFPGGLSPNDIWIKFQNFNTPRSRIRTPKHIHWAVDILIKKFGNQTLTNGFLTDMLVRWQQVIPLINRNMNTILSNLTYSQNSQFIASYQNLNNHGFFNVEFLTHLMELLMIQEKTNYPNAYMFRRVVNGLLTSNDLYSIISTATHTRR